LGKNFQSTSAEAASIVPEHQFLLALDRLQKAWFAALAAKSF
jgi:hypothetical protein